MAHVSGNPTWHDGASGGTPADSTHLENIEMAIDALDTAVDGISGGLTAISYADMPPGSVFNIIKSGGVWPARYSSRADLTFIWTGANPSPAIVTSGTGGMLDGVDKRDVTS